MPAILKQPGARPYRLERNPKKEAHRSLGGLQKSYKTDVVGTVSGRQLTETCRVRPMVRRTDIGGHP
jgi:hypothetical protein